MSALPDTDGHNPLARVFVAGPMRLYCEGLACLLAREDGIEVVGIGTDRHEIIARVAKLEPDVVLLDPTLPDGMQTIRELALGLETFRLSLRADTYGVPAPGLVPVRGT